MNNGFIDGNIKYECALINVFCIYIEMWWFKIPNQNWVATKWDGSVKLGSSSQQELQYMVSWQYKHQLNWAVSIVCTECVEPN